MEDLGYKISSLTAFRIADDKLLKAFAEMTDGDKNNAYKAYSEICSILLTENKSLCEYLHDLMVYTESPLIEAFIRNGSINQRNAISFDLGIIKEIAAITPDASKTYLYEKFNDAFALCMPMYDCGSFDYDEEYFINHIRKCGSGIYAKYKAFTFADGKLKPVPKHDSIRLSDLKKYETQRRQIIENTLCLINGKPANNVLLYGDRGTGKSSTIKALLNEYDELRIVQLDKQDIPSIPHLFEVLQNVPLKFILFIDDLSFNEDEEGFNVLKQCLDGSLTVRPANILIYATTNRRHIIKETNSGRNGDAVHTADAIDDNMSLTDRFGLFITFTSPGKELYLEIIRQLVADRGIVVDAEVLETGAERFALKRCGRSPRIAKQYVDMIESRIALGLEI